MSTLREANDLMFAQITGASDKEVRKKISTEEAEAIKKHKEALIANQRNQALRTVSTEELVKLTLQRLPVDVSLAMMVPNIAPEFVAKQKDVIFDFYLQNLIRE